MRALIFGITGQDGSLLARHLLDRGQEVTGTTRDMAPANLRNLAALGLADRLRLVATPAGGPAEIEALLADTAPDEVYHLGGPSTVALAALQPLETWHGIADATLHLLEAIRRVNPGIRLFNAGSCYSFGDTGDQAADETTPFRPIGPYAVAKTAATQLVAAYRETYGLFACTGILFNHESPLRPESFVTQKIVRAACRIANGSREILELGNLQVRRDWGWAPEYVDAIGRMLQAPLPDDFVIATGETHSLQDFVETAFAELGLDWTRHVTCSEKFMRPGCDPQTTRANPAKAREQLGWQARVRMHEVARRMVAACRQGARADPAGLESG